MAQTLDDVVLEQMQTNETLQRVDRRLDNFITLWFSNKMDEMEMMRERISVPAPTAPAENTKPEKSTEGLGFGFAAMVAGLTGAVIGFTSGFVTTLNNMLKFIKIDLGKVFLKWGNSFKAIFSADGAIGKAVSKVGTFFKPMLDFFGRIGKFFSGGGVLQKVFASIGKFFQPIATFVGKFGATFAKFFGFFKVLGRIFLPITVAIEVISALFKEMSSLDVGATVVDKIQAFSKGILKGLINVVMIPLDMIINGIAWLSKKMFGDTSFSKALEGFSLSTMFNDIVDWIGNLLKAVGHSTMAALRALVTPGASSTDAFKKEFASIMSGAGPSSPAENAVAVSSGGAGARNQRRIGQANSRTTVAEMSEENLAKAVVTAQDKSVAERLSKSTMRDEISGQIGKESLAVAGNATVNITNVNNVNAPTTTQNNVQTSSSESMLGNPTSNRRRNRYQTG